jgi:nucleoside-triphosphatase THEP1
MDGLIYVLTGDRGSGKSTVCARVAACAAERGLDAAGILTERAEGGQDSARRVVDVASGEERPFGARPERGAPGDPNTSDPLTPGWEYDPGMFEWANEVLSRSAPCDLLVIDEIGPLELLGGRGWAKALDVLRSGAFGAALVVCRPGLLKHLEVSLGGSPKAVFEVTPQTRDALPSRIAEVLLRGLSGG